MSNVVEIFEKMKQSNMDRMGAADWNLFLQRNSKLPADFNPMRINMVYQIGCGEHGYSDDSDYIEPVDGKNYFKKCVIEEGGCEGGGEYVNRVYAVFEDLGTSAIFQGFVQVTGCYYSYDGITYNDDYREVIPKEVTVIQYA